MKKIGIGLLAGVIGTIINIVFLLFTPNLKIEIYLSTALTWIAIGILISISDLKQSHAIKGVLIALLVSAPSFVYTVASSLSGAMWTIINTVVVGAILGNMIGKVSSKTE